MKLMKKHELEMLLLILNSKETLLQVDPLKPEIRNTKDSVTFMLCHWEFWKYQHTKTKYVRFPNFIGLLNKNLDKKK